jgi:hypothetical protein
MPILDAKRSRPPNLRVAQQIDLLPTGRPTDYQYLTVLLANRATCCSTGYRGRNYGSCLDFTVTCTLCVCHNAGVLCTIYCHRRTGECPNQATGPAYTQVAIIDEPENDEVEE